MAETMEDLLTPLHVAAVGTHNGDGSIQSAAGWYAFETGSVHAATPSGSVKARSDLTAKASLARRNWLDLGKVFGGLFETPAYMLRLG